MTSASPLWRYRNWLFPLFLLLATFVAYRPAWHAGFVWNDETCVTQNPDMLSFQGLERIWFNAGKQYYPLTYSTFWLQYRLWGLNAAPYHLFNIFLQAVVATVLWFVLRRLRIPGAWLAAAIFALHPVNVESVAWITERKNTLSGVFYLCSILAALRFWLPEETAVPGSHPPERFKDWKFYWLAFGLFVLALFSKTTTIPLPAVVLLLVWWKRGKVLPRDVYPLLPFVVAGVGVGYVTHWAENRLALTGGADDGYSVLKISIFARLLIASRDIWFYLAKLVWPHPLIFIYPRWNVAPSFPGLLSLLAIAALAIVLWVKRNTWGRPLFVTLAYFVGLLFLTLGFFNVFFFNYSFVTDHFQYLACMGPIAAAAAAITLVFDRFVRRTSSPAVEENPSGNMVKVAEPALCRPEYFIFVLCLLGLLGALTWMQCRVYTDNETLWWVTLARNPNAFLGYDNLGVIFMGRGQVDEAIDEYRKALALFESPVVYHNLGNALLQKGMLDEALTNFQRALQIQPAYIKGNADLGNYYIRIGRPDTAIQYYQKSLRLKPDDASDYYGLGNAYMQERQLDLAIGYWQKAVDIQTNLPLAHNNLGNAFMSKGQIRDAIQHWQAALAGNPELIGAQVSLAWVWATAPDPSLRNGPGALALAEQAATLTRLQDPLVIRSFAAAYAENADYSDAVAAAQDAIQKARANPRLVAEIQKELKYYQAQQPYRDQTLRDK